MTREELFELKNEYERKLEKQNRLERLLDSKKVREYIDLLEYSVPKIYSNDEIMKELLKTRKIKNSHSIYINNGLYYTFSELRLGNWNKEKRLIKITDIDREPLSKEENLMSKIENDFYNLESGKKETASRANNDIIITLPSMAKRIENLKPFDGSLNNEERIYDSNLDNEILRTKFFLRLMNNRLEDIISYYSNPRNWQQIDNELEEYKQKVKVR